MTALIEIDETNHYYLGFKMQEENTIKFYIMKIIK